MLAQRLGIHAARLKRNPVVAVAFVEPPRVIEETLLCREPAVEGGTRKWCEMVERRDVERVFLGEGQGMRETFWCVAVVTEDERSVNTDAVSLQVGQGFFKAPTHRVEGLVHVLQVFRIKTLEADEHALTPAAPQQFQKLFVMRRVDARLADPA